MKKSILILFSGLFAFFSCQKNSEESDSPDILTEKGEKVEPEISQTSQFPSGIIYQVPDWEKEFEWDEETIRKNHKKLTLTGLPSFINRVWGVGGKHPDGDLLAQWAFVVPNERIGEFKGYLRDLGVPEEYMDKNTPFFRRSDRENWTKPDTPVAKLNFLMAETAVGSGKRRGLQIVAGQSRQYNFENPNLAHSELRIWFDPDTGHTVISEIYISPDW